MEVITIRPYNQVSNRNIQGILQKIVFRFRGKPHKTIPHNRLNINSL
jgi:hypothetical protein